MGKMKNLFEIGDKINIIRSEYNEYIYPSQVLDIIDCDTYLISGPICKNYIIPLHVGEIVKIMYIKQNKGRYMFYSKISNRQDKDIYVLKVKRLGNIKRVQERNFYRLNIKIPVKKIYNFKIKDRTQELEEDCISEDISGSGINILCNFDHLKKDIITCIFNLNTSKMIIKGEIIRIEKIDHCKFKYALGINFIDIKNEQVDEIVKFIFNEQIKLREKGLI